MQSIALRLLLPLLVLLAACVPGYGPKGWSGIGYDDAPLDGNTVRVSYAGGSALDLETVERYTFYRCAEVTVERGFDYFIIVDGTAANLTKNNVSTKVNSETKESPSSGEFSGTKGTTTTATTSVSSSTSHLVMKTIKLFKGTKPTDNYSAYDAREVLTTLEPKIKK